MPFSGLFDNIYRFWLSSSQQSEWKKNKKQYIILRRLLSYLHEIFPKLHNKSGTQMTGSYRNPYQPAISLFFFVMHQFLCFFLSLFGVFHLQSFKFFRCPVTVHLLSFWNYIAEFTSYSTVLGILLYLIIFFPCLVYLLGLGNFGTCSVPNFSIYKYIFSWSILSDELY